MWVLPGYDAGMLPAPARGRGGWRGINDLMTPHVQGTRGYDADSTAEGLPSQEPADQ